MDTQTVDIRRAVTEEIPYGNNPLLLQCKKHQDDAASLAIYPGHLVCYGCGFNIRRRMEALAYLLNLPSYKEAIEVAHLYQFLPETERQQSQAKPTRPPIKADVEIYQDILYDTCSDRLNWLYNRGLTPQTVRTSRIGHNGAAFVISVYGHDYKLVTLRYRNDEEVSGTHIEEYDEEGEVIKTKKIPKYRGWSGNNNACLYPEWKIAHDKRSYIVLVEGELDTLRLWQEGAPAATVTNGASQQTLILDLLEVFLQATDKYRRPPIKHIIVCGDRDEPGIAAARTLFHAAKERGYYTTWLQWEPEKGKDITDLLNSQEITFQQARELYEYEVEI